MTTKPRASKFRIRRTAAGAAMRPKASGDTEATPKAADPQPAAGKRDALFEAATRTKKTAAAGDMQASDVQASDVQAPDPGATEIDAIRAEGLTSRQLRMARRVAMKHKIDFSSDLDAVRQLRLRGIDPFDRGNMLELVVPRDDAPKAGLPARRAEARTLPKIVEKEGAGLPGPELSPAERRNLEISRIQRDIMLRRRRKMALLMARLAFFVLLPTAIAGYYFYKVATPMYSAKSEFLILQADGGGGGAGLGGLLSGTQFATSQDSIAVQSYLQSKDAMLRLDKDVGFKAHFSQDWIDPIQRLDPGATNEEAYKTYRKNVKLGYDPTEGVIRMEVIAADPQISTEFSRNLISYAEDRVNSLSQQKRGDQMKDARQSFEEAEIARREAQEALVELQQKGALLDPEGVIVSLRQQINNVEIQIQENELELAALLDNARPNQAKVDGTRGDIRRLEDLKTRLNERMLDASKGENSLAQLSVRIQMAQADLATRDMMLQSALQQVEQTRMEANRQVRYLTTSVEPVPPEEASFPRKFENTILAFLVFAGIYLMISLTASILREQVTS